MKLLENNITFSGRKINAEWRRRERLNRVAREHGQKVADSLAHLTTAAQIGRAIRRMNPPLTIKIENTTAKASKKAKAGKQERKFQELVTLIGAEKAKQYALLTSRELSSVINETRRHLPKQPKLRKAPKTASPEDILKQGISSLIDKARKLFTDSQLRSRLRQLWRKNPFGRQNLQKHVAELQQSILIDGFHGGQRSPRTLVIIDQQRNIVNRTNETRLASLIAGQLSKRTEIRDLLKQLKETFSRQEIIAEMSRQMPVGRELFPEMSGLSLNSDTLPLLLNPNKLRVLRERTHEWVRAVGRFCSPALTKRIQATADNDLKLSNPRAEMLEFVIRQAPQPSKFHISSKYVPALLRMLQTRLENQPQVSSNTAVANTAVERGLRLLQELFDLKKSTLKPKTTNGNVKQPIVIAV